MSAAASRRAHVLPYAKGSDDVTSTAGFATARFVKTNLYFPQECRAGTKGDVLGLRFTQALQPTSPLMEEDPYLLELAQSLGDEREDRHFAAGCLSVGNGVQASGRVDIPGGDFTVINHRLQMSADTLAAAAKSTDLVGFFVQVLNGSSLSITLKREETILDLVQLLSGLLVSFTC